MTVLKIRQIGNSVGVILPKEVVSRLHLSAGDTVVATVTPDGVNLTPYDPDFDDAMAAFGRTRAKYRNALRELANS